MKRPRTSRTSPPLQVRISPEMRDRVERRAEAEDRSVSWIVRKALELYLAEEKAA
jgi:predicted transcriptional regulator